MRIIFDINAKATVGCGTRPYAKHVHLEKPDSFIADVTIFPRCPFTGEEEQEIEIYGSAVYILAAFREIVSVLEVFGQDQVKAGELMPGWDDVEAHEERWRKIRAEGSRDEAPPQELGALSGGAAH